MYNPFPSYMQPLESSRTWSEEVKVWGPELGVGEKVKNQKGGAAVGRLGLKTTL